MSATKERKMKESNGLTPTRWRKGKSKSVPWHQSRSRNHFSSASALGDRLTGRSTCRCRRCWCAPYAWSWWARRSCSDLSWASDAICRRFWSAYCSSSLVASGSTWNTVPRARCRRPSLLDLPSGSRHLTPCGQKYLGILESTSRDRQRVVAFEPPRGGRGWG